MSILNHIYKKVKWYRYRPCVAQMVGRGIALLFHDRGTRRGWMVSSTPRPHFTPGKDPVPILQEAGWGPGPVWTGGKSRTHRDSIPDRPAHHRLLYRLSYPAHKSNLYLSLIPKYLMLNCWTNFFEKFCCLFFTLWSNGHWQCVDWNGRFERPASFDTLVLAYQTTRCKPWSPHRHENWI